MNAPLVLAFLAGLTRAQAPSDVPYRVEEAVSCELKSEEKVGPGCWSPTADCLRQATDKKALREALTEAEKVPTVKTPGVGWKTVAIFTLIGVGAGLAVGVSL